MVSRNMRRDVWPVAEMTMEAPPNQAYLERMIDPEFMQVLEQLHSGVANVETRLACAAMGVPRPGMLIGRHGDIPPFAAAAYQSGFRGYALDSIYCVEHIEYALGGGIH